MALRQHNVKAYVAGVHNLVDDELVPKDGAVDSLNWLNKDGRIELVYGRQSVGDEGDAGKNYGEHTAYRADGTEVRFRKVEGKIQHLVGTTWTDTLTGLGNGDVTFTNYSSLAGAFLYVSSPSIGIYKICTANPASAVNMYDEAKNFKGYMLVDTGRSLLWGRTQDPTGLYGSWIDAQNGTVYTTVTNENLASGDGTTTVFSGTLAFKAGGATRTCHGVTVTVTGGEVLTDDFNGNLTGNLGATGTINYATGAWSITFTVAPASASNNIRATYQWENSNAKGVTDFTFSATRLAGEGFMIRQDVGGDKIEQVVVHDGSYFSFKQRSVYQFTLDVDDTAPRNELLRADIGVSGLRSAFATSAGIVFMNTGNPTRPQLNILKRNPFGDNFTTEPLFPQFKFENYKYDDTVLFAWDRFMLVGCKERSNENNRLLFCDMQTNSVNITNYGTRTLTKSLGLVHAGDPVSQTTYELLTGFDDMGTAITNYWIGNGERYGVDSLKKVKRLRFRGLIDPNQIVEVSVSTDNSDFQKIGVIRGDGDYVDYSASQAIGTTFIGEETIGGGVAPLVYPFYMELKLKWPKFRKIQIKLESIGLGYFALQETTHFDIWLFEQHRLPKQYRSKQNVSITGEVDT
jgi:hypothetical protein